jgi:hypothetical protein
MRPLSRIVKMKTRTLDTAVIDKIINLHRGEISRHLRQKGPIRTGNEFAPNSYFTVLTHITMKPGYTLEYVYDYNDDFAGRPLLYARLIGEKLLGKVTEYRKWEKKNTLLSFLIRMGLQMDFFSLSFSKDLQGNSI